MSNKLKLAKEALEEAEWEVHTCKSPFACMRLTKLRKQIAEMEKKNT